MKPNEWWATTWRRSWSRCVLALQVFQGSAKCIITSSDGTLYVEPRGVVLAGTHIFCRGSVLRDMVLHANAPAFYKDMIGCVSFQTQDDPMFGQPPVNLPQA